MKQATIRIDEADPTPALLKDCFAEIFAALDESPTPLLVTVHTANILNAKFTISIVKGEPLFEMDGSKPAAANFRGRWLALHPSPLQLSCEPTRFMFIPTTGNRVAISLVSRFRFAALSLIDALKRKN